MASLTQWTWVWVSSRSWWWTGKLGMLQSMGSKRVGHDWATELNWALTQKLMWDFWGLTVGNDKGLTWQALGRKTTLPTPVLVPSKFTVVPKGSCSQRLRHPGWACFLHMCIPNPEAFIPMSLYLKPQAKVFRCLCQRPYQRAKWGTLKTFSPQWFVVVVAQLLSLLWLFCNPMDCSPTGSPVHGISQARILEWVAPSFSRGSSQPRDWTHISCIGSWILYHWATRETHNDSCSVLVHSQHPPHPHPLGSGSRNLPEASVWESLSMRWPQCLHQSPWPSCTLSNGGNATGASVLSLVWASCLYFGLSD